LKNLAFYLFSFQKDASLSPQVAENSLEINSLVCEDVPISYGNLEGLCRIRCKKCSVSEL